eukprot:479936_1
MNLIVKQGMLVECVRGINEHARDFCDGGDDEFPYLTEDDIGADTVRAYLVCVWYLNMCGKSIRYGWDRRPFFGLKEIWDLFPRDEFAWMHRHFRFVPPSKCITRKNKHLPGYHPLGNVKAFIEK